MANGFVKDICDWYNCDHEPEILMKGYPYGAVVVCNEHRQCIPLAVRRDTEFRHGIIMGTHTAKDY